jgi:hypothetical protein
LDASLTHCGISRAREGPQAGPRRRGCSAPGRGSRRRQIADFFQNWLEQETEMRSGGIGIVGVIVIVLVILWLVGVIKL